jgi:hypothetical protein
MARGSFATGALSDVTAEDVGRMLGLGETLFVEHKHGLGGDSYQLASAVSAFANTLGGWVLLGVDNGKPVGKYADWSPSPAATLGDAVRDRLLPLLDPLPPFEARIIDLETADVGVVRVYESADTPHVMIKTGAVFVREGAGGRDANRPESVEGAKTEQQDRIYKATQIRTRAQLIELAHRGERAGERVQALLDPANATAVGPLIGLVFQQVTATAHALKAETSEGVYVLAAPYTLPPRFRGWATSHDATEAVAEAASRVARAGDYAPDRWVESHLGGCSIEVPRPLDQVRDGLGGELFGVIRAAVSNDGVVGVSIALNARGADEPRTELLEPAAFAASYIEPVLGAALEILFHGEFLGRALTRVELVRAGDSLGIVTPRPVARRLTVDDDLTVPQTSEELTTAALRAANALARTGGARAWDPV